MSTERRPSELARLSEVRRVGSERASEVCHRARGGLRRGPAAGVVAGGRRRVRPAHRRRRLVALHDPPRPAGHRNPRHRRRIGRGLLAPGARGAPARRRGGAVPADGRGPGARASARGARVPRPDQPPSPGRAALAPGGGRCDPGSPERRSWFRACWPPCWPAATGWECRPTSNPRTPRNLDFYRRLGFRSTGEVCTVDERVTLTLMWRLPGAPR